MCYSLQKQIMKISRVPPDMPRELLICRSYKIGNRHIFVARPRSSSGNRWSVRRYEFDSIGVLRERSVSGGNPRACGYSVCPNRHWHSESPHIALLHTSYAPFTNRDRAYDLLSLHSSWLSWRYTAVAEMDTYILVQ